MRSCQSRPVRAHQCPDLPDGRDGVTEDAAKPPVGERLEGPAEALGVGGAAPAGLLDGAVNTEALQAEPDTFYIELAVDKHGAKAILTWDQFSDNECPHC